MKHLFLFLICQLSFAFTAWGNPAEIPPAVMFKQLSTTEGLSNNSVRSIFRDSRGFLWIGTESGLNKYDATRSGSITGITPNCPTMPSSTSSKDRK